VQIQTSYFPTSPISYTWPSYKEIQEKIDDRPFENPSEIFENPFDIEDLQVFDDPTLRRLLKSQSYHLTIEELASALHGASEKAIEHVRHNLQPDLLPNLEEIVCQTISVENVKAARERILHHLFWDLTYWKIPEVYDELTEGETLHPGIFEHLKPVLRNRVVLDAGAGTGRATFECLRCESKFVYAVDPSPGVLGVLRKKLAALSATHRVDTRQGSFEQLPLESNSVDVALTCSAFRTAPGQGGEAGLAEFSRVIRPGGKFAIIWPCLTDYVWLAEHGFHYVAFQENEKAVVRFRSLESALKCSRLFYAGNKVLIDYLLDKKQPEVLYSMLGFRQPSAYCWLTVLKDR
jgi:ubiquinone/menaquinone biosynthesis C-methylase UbiE